MTDKELLPCPFCGGKAEMHIVDSNSLYVYSKKEIPKNAWLVKTVAYGNNPPCYEYKEHRYVPRCKQTDCCGRLAKPYKTEAIAIKKWNSRMMYKVEVKVID